MMIARRFLCALLAGALGAPGVGAHDHDASRPDSHAPLGVMGDHVHKRGEWMFSYRHMTMEMDGNRVDGNRVGTGAVLAGFPIAPLQMRMKMQMFGAMYAPRDDLTLMLMIPRVEVAMDHVNRMGVRFSTETQGVGDISLTALAVLHREGRDTVHANLGWGFPTGDADPRDATPLGAATLLPYPMRIGAGTHSFRPGLTWNRQLDGGSWGAQASAVIQVSDDNGYALGDRKAVTGWRAWVLDETWSTSLRLNYERWSDVEGADPRLPTALVPTARPDLRGGARLDLGLGVNFKAKAGHRLAMEFLLPLKQELDGPQLETDWSFVLGYQFAW